MAKKKGKSSAKAACTADKNSPTAPALDREDSPTAAEASEGPSPERPTIDKAPSPDVEMEAVETISVKVSSSSSALDDLRRELDACKQQIAELQAQNASLTEDNKRLKESQAGMYNAPAPLATTGQDFETLTQRLAAVGTAVLRTALNDSLRATTYMNMFGF